MEVKKELKRQIVFEIFSLIFLVAVLLYAFFAIDHSNRNKIKSLDGMVIVLDDSKFSRMVASSDGKGLESGGITYTITNNNEYVVSYKVVAVPNTSDEEILKQVRIGIDDIYISDLGDLDKLDNGYVIYEGELNPGYTKVVLFKQWYKLETADKIANEDLTFTFELVKGE